MKRVLKKSLIKIFLIGFLATFCLLQASCNQKKTKLQYKIALDTSWNSFCPPSEVPYLTAFTVEILEKIGQNEKINLFIYQDDAPNLAYKLNNKIYSAICSSEKMDLLDNKTFATSDLFIPTGPVIMAAQEFHHFSGKIIGILQESYKEALLQHYPDAILRSYDSAADICNDIQNEVLDGGAIDFLTAQYFAKNTFSANLKIVSPPLTSEGFRFVELNHNTSSFTQTFNRGLKKIKKNGCFSKIAKKWNLPLEL